MQNSSSLPSCCCSPATPPTSVLLQDIVERFHLMLVLCFVVVEDISNSGTWLPSWVTLRECGRIYLWEVREPICGHPCLLLPVSFTAQSCQVILAKSSLPGHPRRVVLLSARFCSHGLVGCRVWWRPGRTVCGCHCVISMSANAGGCAQWCCSGGAVSRMLVLICTWCCCMSFEQPIVWVCCAVLCCSARYLVAVML